MDLESKAKIDSETKEDIEISEEAVENHEFDFPFKPYDIQLDLMKEAFKVYDEKKFAILESPTGTGKSLSLICSAMTWLRQHQKEVKRNLENERNEILIKSEALKKQEDESGDWIEAQTKQQAFTRRLKEIDKELEKISKFDQRAEARRHAKLHNANLDDYSAFSSKARKEDHELIENTNNQSIIGSQESQKNSDELDVEKKIVEDQEEEQVRPKIYYASRTHSQLSQFVNEIKKTKFADTIHGTPVRVVPLGSRANLCVNPEVFKLRDSNAINEKCMELQKETNKEKRCPYAKLNQVNSLKEDILASVKDIEDIVGRGKVMGSCAYYATRMAVAEAEVVVLPYNNLLHSETRKASSLDLKDNIVILDEAHNILETLCSIHSSSINGLQLLGAHTTLARYYSKYHTRMSPKNAELIKNIVQCLTSLIKFLNEPEQHLRDYDCPKSVHIDEDSQSNHGPDMKDKGSNAKVTHNHKEFMIDVSKLIGAANIERFNVFKILDYFNRSQLARKLLGFFHQNNSIDLTLELHGLVQKDTEKNVCIKSDKKQSPVRKKRKVSLDPKKNEVVNISSEAKLELTSLEFLKKTNTEFNKRFVTIPSYPIYILVEFFRSLTSLNSDGRILIDYYEGDVQQSMLKFILLNPHNQFEQVIQEARSIVLAGGTMQPFDEFFDLIFRPLEIDRDRLSLFSCGHIIQPNQLFVTTVSTGPRGKPLELSFKTRSMLDYIDEIGVSIREIASVVPGGLICFLPSYDYEMSCFNRWTQMGILRTIESRYKRVFREPRHASHLKPILDEYSRTIEKGKSKGKGAILLSVVGGKMSEGINFNDDLGRCVVMVGLPYANIKSIELQQKMTHYDKVCKTTSATSQLSAGQKYYENLCIKSINQSIGRSIRHKDDYASIILLDRRYSSKTTIRNGLPGWLQTSLVDHDQFQPMLVELRKFFALIRDPK